MSKGDDTFLKTLPGQPDAGELSSVLAWVDPRFGPIRSLSGFSPGGPYPGWWIFQCQLSRPLGRYYIDSTLAPTGTSIDPSEALKKSLGEAVERYCGFNAFVAARTERLSAKESPLLNRFPKCVPDEPYALMLDTTNLEALLTHVPVERLASGECVWIPAPFVYMDFVPAGADPPVTQRISTGLAFQTNLHKAIWSGICEVVERDAIMTMWWAQRRVRKLDTNSDSLPYALADRLRRLNGYGITPHFFDISTEVGIPTVFCVLESKQSPHWLVSAAAGSDPLKVCIKALDEGVGIRFMQSRYGRPCEFPSLTNFRWVRDIEARVALYAGWEQTPAFDFLFQNPDALLPLDEFAKQDWRPEPQSMEDLRQLAVSFEQKELTILWADLTVDEAGPLGKCVRVVIPEMVPMSSDHNVRWLGSRHMSSFKAGNSVSDFNPYPHPFP